MFKARYAKAPEDSSDIELLGRLNAKKRLSKNCAQLVAKMADQIAMTGRLEPDTRMVAEVMCDSVKA